ncbi:hypothetical protein CASFOL_024130 [Castilleja foliolosa]|uniref:Uncharacterized protein n=1 Tax=Castilleja foliolosa TaxID=1961234 RepID=A0ABD3CMF9_9LAMI
MAMAMAMACRSYIPKLYTALSYSSLCHATKHLSFGPPPMDLNRTSTGNPCLDFFYHIVPVTPPQTLTQRLQLAWDHDPLKALKLVCNLRGVRGTGKSDEKGAYIAALWLHQNHPKTLACNLDSFASFGNSKDLLEILFLLIEPIEPPPPDVHPMYYSIYTNGESDENLSELRYEKKNIGISKTVVDKYNSDPDFKFLHDRVSDYFAQCFKSDMKVLLSNSGGGDSRSKISQAAKWFPLLYSKYDRFSLLGESIAKKLFPRVDYPEYQEVEDADYTNLVRDRLRTQVLVPLREALELPEVYMEEHDWGSIPYDRISSDAMTVYVDKFLEHDGERFKEYIKNVKTGKAEIMASTLLPHEMSGHYHRGYNWYNNRSREWSRNTNEIDMWKRSLGDLKWNRMVKDMSEKGKLNNCLAICFVPDVVVTVDALVTLGVLVSELSGKPGEVRLITFNTNPVFHRVRGRSFAEKTEFMGITRSQYRYHIKHDLQKVFQTLLRVAVDGKLKADDMIKRVFVFSHMKYDETDYEAIVRMFKENGYGECVPEIVFWNVGEIESAPVQANQTGVALVSGFSNNLMSLFMEYDGIFNPEAVMEAAISGQEYQKLQVFD